VAQEWLFKNIKTTLETINLGPKQIKFLINIKNEKAVSIRVSGLKNYYPIFYGSRLNWD